MLINYQSRSSKADLDGATVTSSHHLFGYWNGSRGHSEYGNQHRIQQKTGNPLSNVAAGPQIIWWFRLLASCQACSGIVRICGPHFIGRGQANSHGKRFRSGECTSSAIAESTANVVISKPFRLASTDAVDPVRRSSTPVYACQSQRGRLPC